MRMKRPCRCDNFVKGQPWVLDRDCRLCWLYHNDSRYRKKWREPLIPLGDWLAWLLSKLGITKVRVEQVTGKPCGCGQRQENLNHLLGDKP